MLFEYLSPVQQNQAFYRFGDGSLIVHYHCLPASHGLIPGQIGLLRFALETYTAQNMTLKSPDDRKNQLSKTFGATLLYEYCKDNVQDTPDSNDIILQRLWLLHPYQINHLLGTSQTSKGGMRTAELHNPDDSDANKTSPNFKYHSNKGLHERLGESTPVVITNQKTQEEWFFSSMTPQVRGFFDEMFFANRSIGVYGQDANIITLEGILGRFVVNYKGESVANAHTINSNSQLRQAWVLPNHDDKDGTFEGQGSLHKDLYELLKQLLILPQKQQMGLLAMADILKSIRIQDPKEHFGSVVLVEPPIFLDADYKYLDFSYLVKQEVFQNFQKQSTYQQVQTSPSRKYLADDDMHIMKLSQLADVSLVSVLVEHAKKVGWQFEGDKLSPVAYQSFIRFINQFQSNAGSFHHYVRFGLGVDSYQPGKTNGLFYFDLPKTAILVGLLAVLGDSDTLVSTSPTVFAAFLSQLLGRSYHGFAFPGVAKSQMSFVKQLVFGDFKQDQNDNLALHSISELSASQQTIKEFMKDCDGVSHAHSTAFFGVLESGKVPPTPLPFLYGTKNSTFGGASEERYLFLSVTQESIIRMVLALNMQLNDRIQRAGVGVFVVHDIDSESQQTLFTWMQVYYKQLYIAQIPNEFAGIDGYVVLFTDPQELPNSQKELEERIAHVGQGLQTASDAACRVDFTPTITDDESLLAWAWRVILEHKMLQLSSLVSQATKQQVKAEFDDSHLFDAPTSIEHKVSAKEITTPLLGDTKDIKQLNEELGTNSKVFNTQEVPINPNANTLPNSMEMSAAKPTDGQQQNESNPNFLLSKLESFEEEDDSDGADENHPEYRLDDVEPPEGISYDDDIDDLYGIGTESHDVPPDGEPDDEDAPNPKLMGVDKGLADVLSPRIPSSIASGATVDSTVSNINKETPSQSLGNLVQVTTPAKLSQDDDKETTPKKYSQESLSD